jgi:hypothetical protein
LLDQSKRLPYRGSSVRVSRNVSSIFVKSATLCGMCAPSYAGIFQRRRTVPVPSWVRTVPRRAVMLPVVLVALLGLVGCGVAGGIVHPSSPLIGNPVWLSDGWIYYRHQADPSSPEDVWRSRPDGSHAVRFVVLAPDGCPVDPRLWRLFPGPGGGLGASQECDESSTVDIVEYPTSGGALVQLAKVPSYFVSWPRGGHTGYVAQTTNGCFGVAELHDGVVAPSTATVTLNGISWPLSPGPQGCPADTGAARNPAVSPDGHHLFVLATPNQRHLHDPGTSLDSVPWQLVRIDDDGSSTPLGPTLPGLTDTVISPDGRTIAVAERPRDHERVILIPADGGPTRDVPVNATTLGFSFSPDSQSLVTTDGIKLHIIRL